MQDSVEKIREVVIKANPEKWGEPGSWGRGCICGLADVLLAIDSTRSQVVFLNFSQYLLCSPRGWNLREDDLTRQSKETIDFIASLLGGE